MIYFFILNYSMIAEVHQLRSRKLFSHLEFIFAILSKYFHNPWLFFPFITWILFNFAHLMILIKLIKILDFNFMFLRELIKLMIIWFDFIVFSLNCWYLRFKVDIFNFLILIYFKYFILILIYFSVVKLIN
jgi:hypothetical protein